MMERAHEKYSSTFACLLLCIFEIGYLYDYAEAFYQEDAAEDGYQPFLPDDDREGGDDAPEGKAARISHEDLCRISIIP